MLRRVCSSVVGETNDDEGEAAGVLVFLCMRCKCDNPVVCVRECACVCVRVHTYFIEGGGRLAKGTAIKSIF